MALLETRMPSTSTWGTTATSNPSVCADAAEGIGIAAPAAAEAVIVADDQFAHAATRHQDVADEPLGRQRRERRVEPEHQRVLHSARGHHRPALHLGGEPEWRPLGPHHLDRVRVEGDHDAGPAGRLRAPRRLPQHRVMGAMHAVERADGDGGAFGAEAEVTHGGSWVAGRGVASTTTGCNRSSTA